MRPWAQAMRSAPPPSSSESRSHALIVAFAGSAVWGAQNYTYTEDAQGLVAWLNEKIANASFRVAHVTLPTGNVSRGSANLVGLPTVLNLVIEGQGTYATTLNLQRRNLDIGAMLGDTGRIEFRNMGITNVRAAASAPPQLLPQSLLFVQGYSSTVSVHRLMPADAGRYFAVCVCLERWAHASRGTWYLTECRGGRRFVEAKRRFRWLRAAQPLRSSQPGFQSWTFLHADWSAARRRAQDAEWGRQVRVGGDLRYHSRKSTCGSERRSGRRWMLLWCAARWRGDDVWRVCRV
jgi:hypothetical protein